MSSSERKNRNRVDQRNSDGSNVERDETASDIDQHNSNVRKPESHKPESHKPNDLKSICYRLLQQIDRSTDLDRGSRLPESDSRTDSHRSNSGQQRTGMEKRGEFQSGDPTHEIPRKDFVDRIKAIERKEIESPTLDLGSFDEPLAVSMESFFEFNFEISESLDDLVADFELKRRMHQWNEWGVDDSRDGAGEFTINERESTGQTLPNQITSKFPK